MADLYYIDIPTAKIREMITNAMNQIIAAREEAREEANKYKAEFIASQRKKWFRNRKLDKLTDEEFWATFNIPNYWIYESKSRCNSYSLWIDRSRNRHREEADAFSELWKQIDEYQLETVKVSDTMMEMLNRTYHYNLPKP